MTNEEFIQSIALEGEEWKIISNWKRYAVSTFGRIASLNAPYYCGNRKCYRKPQLIKPRANNSKPSYLGVVLSDGHGNRKHHAVHRLVAAAFIPNPNNYPFVNHKDENTHNNHLSNLEWCTQQYNCNYGTHNQRMAQTISNTAYQKRKIVQLSLNGTFIAQYNSIKEACLATEINRSSISLCCQGRNKTGCGYKWMYLSDYESLNQ